MQQVARGCRGCPEGFRGGHGGNCRWSYIYPVANRFVPKVTAPWGRFPGTPSVSLPVLLHPPSGAEAACPKEFRGPWREAQPAMTIQGAGPTVDGLRRARKWPILTRGEARGPSEVLTYLSAASVRPWGQMWPFSGCPIGRGFAPSGHGRPQGLLGYPQEPPRASTVSRHSAGSDCLLGQGSCRSVRRSL